MNLGRRGPLVAAGASLVVALLAVFLLVLPKRSEVAAANANLENQQRQEQQLRLKLAEYEADKSRNAENVAGIAKADERVPSTTDERSIIDLVSAAADQAGVDFASLDPGPVTPSTDGSYGVITTAIGVGGSYAQLIEFLHNLETLQRANRVLSGSVSSGGGGTGTSGTQSLASDELSMTLSAEFYTSDTGATAAPAAPAASPSAGASQSTAPAASGGVG
jgi:Tfp pilus assembly protein PilO